MTTPSDDILAGKDQIMTYIHRSDWRAVLQLVKDHAFPARKICGRWEASKSLVDSWHRSMFADVQ